MRLLLRHDTRRGRVAWISVREPSDQRITLLFPARFSSARALPARLYSSVLACSSLHIRHDQYSPDRVCTHRCRYIRSAQVCVSREIHLPTNPCVQRQIVLKEKCIEFIFSSCHRKNFGHSKEYSNRCEI